MLTDLSGLSHVVLEPPAVQFICLSRIHAFSGTIASSLILSAFKTKYENKNINQHAICVC